VSITKGVSSTHPPLLFSPKSPAPLPQSFWLPNNEVLDNHFYVMIEELHRIESRITNNVFDWCSKVERCVADTEQKTEARLISLEMAHSEMEVAHADLL
jgi:hypothetical protein